MANRHIILDESVISNFPINNQRKNNVIKEDIDENYSRSPTPSFR